jgi:hypothetical protein
MPAFNLTKDKKIFSALKMEYDAYIKPSDRDIRDYILPQGARFPDDDSYPNDGKRRDIKILNSTAATANENLTSGMWSGVTSPTNDWFKLTTGDRTLKEVASVKEYFEEVTRSLLAWFGGSNFYTSMETLYSSMAAFGIGALQMDADNDKMFSFTNIPVGEFYIDVNHKGVPDTIYREFSMRADTVIEKFGKENVSSKVINLTDKNKSGSDWVKIIHFERPNTDRDATKIDARNMPFISVYYEADNNDAGKKALRVSGYRTQPFIAPRWRVTGTEVYGSGPGTVAIGDVKMLQTLEEKLLIALAKEVQPPVIADPSLDVINTSANGITWADKVTQGQGPAVTELYSKGVRAEIDKIEGKILRVENRIKEVHHSNLFFLLGATEGPEKTATEIREAKAEKLRILGPIIERLTPEALQYLIERAFDIAEQLGRLPEPPVELRGKEIKIKIISEIAQAQKLAVITPIQQTVATVAGLAQLVPSVIDKLNADQVTDETAEAYGAPAGIVRSDDEVAAIREEKAQAAARQQALIEAQGMIDSAKTASETSTGGDTVLSAIAG